jgi:hypothetical protein
LQVFFVEAVRDAFTSRLATLDGHAHIQPRAEVRPWLPASTSS